ncbi:MAG: flavin prenyltransferase UbiX [Planctomycetaceae bacterium]
MYPIVLAITGASGAAYGVRLLQVLLAAGRNVHLAISPAAVRVAELELGLSIDVDAFDPEQILTSANRTLVKEGVRPGQIVYHHFQNHAAAIASGSFRTGGMVICPCSMGTLAAVANGLSSNLIHRAADVHLKERRKLIVVPRETPLGLIQIENMRKLTEAGGIVLPAAPGFYHRPLSIDDLVDFVVARICDQLKVDVNLTRRWGEGESGAGGESK